MSSTFEHNHESNLSQGKKKTNAQGAKRKRAGGKSNSRQEIFLVYMNLAIEDNGISATD
jgi:hypothetical protein